MRLRRKRDYATLRSVQPQVGWHKGWLTSIQIQRRQGRAEGVGYMPSGWDLVDTQSQQIIAEFNDETAPPRQDFSRGFAGLTAENGNEITDMFKEIYNICYQTTLQAMKLAGGALPEHEDSNDGEPIAQIVIGAYSRLPQTVRTTKKEAMAATQPF
jgi:hypothetical protein